MFATFNSALQQEWNLRKFRFRQQKLLRTRDAAEGPAGADEQDELSLHDCVVTVFLDDVGKHYWCIGFIEEIIVARGTIVAGSSQAVLNKAAETADHHTQVPL